MTNPWRPSGRATSWRPLGRTIGTLVLSVTLIGGGLGTATAATSSTAGAVVAAPVSTIAAAAVPKITKQPTNVQQLAGKAIRYAVTATGENLRYRWYVRYPGTSKWVATEHEGASFSIFARTNRDGYQFRVVVANSVGAVTSSTVGLKVFSTPTDPVPLKMMARLRVWQVAAVESSPPGSAWASIKKANRFNEAPPVGYDYVQTRFRVRHIGTGKFDPAFTLDFKFVTNDGKIYKAAPVVTSDDLFDVGPTARAVEESFTVAAAVPRNKIASGSWVVTDYTNYKDRQLGYFAD